MKKQKKRSSKRNNKRTQGKNFIGRKRCKKNKFCYRFHTEHACSIKALSVKENNAVKPTTRLFSRKMLMFAKLLLKSFIYNLIETFVFPD